MTFTCLLRATLIMLCLFIYIPMSYPQYAASLFTANDFFRSAFAAGAVLYSRPMFLNLGVGQGCSLMGGLCFGCIGGMFALYYYGAAMRARSKFLRLSSIAVTKQLFLIFDF
jgi:MFS transporter, DHA1 family, multidrug resistance protein